MIICPNCKHQEAAGAIFCSDCGAQLAFADSLNTSTIQFEKIPSQPSFETAPTRPVVITNPKARFLLFLLDSGETIPLEGRKEFTLGRYNEGQPIMPDVDLTPYKAYESGISRLHAIIRIKDDNTLTITDLGSSNGSHVNGVRLASNTPKNLAKGDTIALGKLRIQIIINE
jgi:pSer/pThr/pTyr-binding forkhead associated (FHA) protein